MKRKVKSIALTLIVALILQMIPSKVFAFDLVLTIVKLKR